MAPIIIAITVVSALVQLGTNVAGLDLSIAQDQAGKAKLSTLVAPVAALVALPPAPVAMAAAPVVPLCPRLTAAMQDDALNLIELSRVTGNCR